jgi:hypothetical protein
MKIEVEKRQKPAFNTMVTLNADKLGKLIKDSANHLETEKNEKIK